MIEIQLEEFDIMWNSEFIPNFIGYLIKRVLALVIMFLPQVHLREVSPLDKCLLESRLAILDVILIWTFLLHSRNHWLSDLFFVDFLRRIVSYTLK